MKTLTKLFLSLLTLGVIYTASAETLTIESDLDVEGTLTVGDSVATPLAGAIRWTGTDLEGFDGSEWKSLTQSSGGSSTDQTLSISGNDLTISGTGGNMVTLPAGLNGADGVDGATWLTGAGVPSDANGLDGDLYLDTSSGDYYVKASGTWGSAAGNLTGPQGPAGADGADGTDGINGTDGQDGAIWLVGSGTPADIDGSNGDLYLDTSTGDFYAKASDTWGSPVGNLKGADGVDGTNGTDGTNGVDGIDGATWLTGAGVPGDASGTDGDFYLDTSNGDYYTKTSGTWGSTIGNLTGPQGVAGADGADGADGASPFVLSGSDVHFTGGNVGIGITTPGEALDVTGNVRVDGALFVVNHSGDIPAITY